MGNTKCLIFLISKSYDNRMFFTCFYKIIKVRDCATKKVMDYYETVADKIWNIYRTESKRQMAQQIRRLREWVSKNVPTCAMKDNILKLCKKRVKWLSLIHI